MCIAYGLLNVLLAHVGGAGDGYMLLASGAEILCGYVDDAVRVDIEGDLDLRYSAGSRRNAVKCELAESGVACCHFTFALEDVDLNRGLVVGCGGIHLALLHRYGGVAVDNAVEHAAERLDTE